MTGGETRLALSGLAMGKKYIVTIIAYRGSKRSRTVETVFSTGNAIYFWMCTVIFITFLNSVQAIWSYNSTNIGKAMLTISYYEPNITQLQQIKEIR